MVEDMLLRYHGEGSIAWFVCSLLDRHMRERQLTARRQWMQICSIPATLSKFSRSPSSAEAGSLGYEAAFLARADYSRAELEPIEGDWNTSNILKKGHHRRRKTARLRLRTLMDGLWQLDHHEKCVKGGASKG